MLYIMSDLNNIPLKRWEVFQQKLRERFIHASEKYPTVRVWKRSHLIHEIQNVIKTNKEVLFTTFPSATTSLEYLQSLGWMQPISIEVAASKENLAFYFVDMEAENSNEVDPMELLQAYLPDGVLCYFSALTYYGLTTQIPSHYHIAKPVPEPLDSRPAFSSAIKGNTSSPQNEALGQLAFSLSGVPCYWTKRQKNWMPGVQTRAKSPRTWLRITSLEQTLLDTLLQPQRCGGVSVILEAWKTGFATTDQEKMYKHLAAISSNDLNRRVGAFTDYLGFQLTHQKLMEILKESQEKSVGFEAIPLFKGYALQNLSEKWNVFVS
jgi:hypothetical protein